MSNVTNPSIMQGRQQRATNHRRHPGLDPRSNELGQSQGIAGQARNDEIDNGGSYEKQLRIAWGITGAGHLLSSCVEILLPLEKADVFFSAAGLEVVKLYDLYNSLLGCGHTLYTENDAGSLPVTRLYKGAYDLVVIAPTTSNSVAKMVCGISDSLVTNLFAHAGKCKVPLLILPCDIEGDLTSDTHQGEQVSVHVRSVDRDNSKRLAKWPGVTLVQSPNQLGEVLASWKNPNTHL